MTVPIDGGIVRPPAINTTAVQTQGQAAIQVAGNIAPTEAPAKDQTADGASTPLGLIALSLVTQTGPAAGSGGLIGLPMPTPPSATANLDALRQQAANGWAGPSSDDGAAVSRSPASANRDAAQPAAATPVPGASIGTPAASTTASGTPVTAKGATAAADMRTDAAQLPDAARALGVGAARFAPLGPSDGRLSVPGATGDPTAAAEPRERSATPGARPLAGSGDAVSLADRPVAAKWTADATDGREQPKPAIDAQSQRAAALSVPGGDAPVPGLHLDRPEADAVQQAMIGGVEVEGRTGISPSSILNAAMIPGWPAPRAFANVGTHAAQQRPQLNPAMTDEEMLTYLANLGADEAMLAKVRKALTPPLPGKKIMMFLATLATALSVVIKSLKGEVEAMTEEELEAEDIRRRADERGKQSKRQRVYLE